MLAPTPKINPQGVSASIQELVASVASHMVVAKTTDTTKPKPQEKIKDQRQKITIFATFIFSTSLSIL